jgi:transposase
VAARLMRRYLGYKAEAAGMTVDDTVDEHWTTKTCPQCGARTKQRGATIRAMPVVSVALGIRWRG